MALHTQMGQPQNEKNIVDIVFRNPDWVGCIKRKKLYEIGPLYW